MKTYQNNQLEVNPSGVVLVMGCHFPGATPGLLEDDTSGVSNLPRFVLVTAGHRAQGTVTGRAGHAGHASLLR